MSFGWSAGDVVVAVQILCRVGIALSETHGAKAQVKEDMAFLEHLEKTLQNVNKAVGNGLTSTGLQGKVDAIHQPLLKTKSKILSYMELTQDGKGDAVDFAVRSLKKIIYCEYFSKQVGKLKEKIAIPLQGIQLELAMLNLGRLQFTQETLEKGFASTKQFHDKELLHKIKAWLQPVSTVQDTYNTNITSLLPGTCEWLFQKEEYVDWYSQFPKKTSPLLWISGIPGAGKTTLAAKIIQRLGQDGQTVCYFFSKGSAQRSDVRKILTTLCWELLNQFSEDGEFLQEAYYKGGEPTETDMKDCLSLICEKRNAVILVDGLDECTLDTRKNLCALLVTLVAHSNVVVISRELEDIKQGLAKIPNHLGLVHINISESDTRDDLKKVIEKETQRLGLSAEETKKEITRRLQIGCKGMFQWATEMIKYLIDSECMYDDEYLTKTDDMPTGLHDLYTKILHHIHKGKTQKVVRISMSLLCWVAFSRRALSLAETAMMLRIRNGMQEHGKITAAEPAVWRQKISSFCGSLVRFVQREGNDVVILAHASVKEFLLGLTDYERTDTTTQKEAKIEAELAETLSQLSLLCRY
ncbi:uncharacterized protein SETTUDRAFT_22509 [Exserohilum turcica Et28A]|uniref:Nephrocystin 3-like N-terminal domain-containing protein n=1 Tax=Exserohilum turcicum (strain 28A) TaxID=671987 RepID=R0K298_EXST2|nr:uncharacterized protein SETTUDRAFT_22509 [Exserohilum turcica Et28A]EOA82522.1 hypothetical protein SETTUDRAFT_22509 [Exserohilum turcica Et28A]